MSSAIQQRANKIAASGSGAGLWAGEPLGGGPSSAQPPHPGEICLRLASPRGRIPKAGPQHSPQAARQNRASGQISSFPLTNHIPAHPWSKPHFFVAFAGFCKTTDPEFFTADHRYGHGWDLESVPLQAHPWSFCLAFAVFC